MRAPSGEGPSAVRHRALALALAAIACGALAGCTVDRPSDLTSRLWTCDEDGDCIDGWGCADRSVLGEDFCRPACDRGDPSSCDGICTRSGECLATCTLLGDGTSACPPGHECVRTDLLGDEGVCFPTATCSRSDECEGGARCFNDVFALPAIVPGTTYASDHLYCVAVPDEADRCATGYVLVPSLDAAEESLCLPRCDTEGSRCPPDLTCLRDLGFLFAQPGTSPCYPGYWALPCDDDAQCMVGRCLEVAPGGVRACTYECGDADRVFGRAAGGGCRAIEDATRGLRLDALTVRCESVAGADVCVPLGTTGAPCNDDMICAPGLDCRAFRSGESVLRFCSRDCGDDQDCNYAGAPITAYCARPIGGGAGSCVPRSYAGGSCARPENCRPGLACREGRCVAAP